MLPGRSSGSPPLNAGVYVGKVTRVVGARAFLTIARTGGTFEYGPARYPAELAATSTLEGGAGGPYDGAPAHVHGLRPLAAGDEVAVAFLEGKRDAVIVLSRLA